MKLRVIIGLLSAFLRWIRSGGRVFEFHRFTFDITTPLGNGAVETLIKGGKLIDLANENYRFTDGTALGLYRDGKFIAHDNDIDVDILNCSSIVRLIILFIQHGFSVGRFVYTKGHVQQIVFFDKSNIIFDVVLWWSSRNNLIENHSEPGYVRSQDIRYFDNKTEFLLDKYEIPLPGRIEEWLETRYGKEWRIPKKYKGDWKDDCHDITRL